MQVMSCKGNPITTINKNSTISQRQLKKYWEHSGYRTIRTLTKLVGEYKLVHHVAGGNIN